VGVCVKRIGKDHSQHGEFLILLNHFISVASKHKIIVDLGARGRERSNSYGLLKYFGWSGLLVEANPRLIANITSEFTGTKFKLLNCAVSDQEGSMPFYIGVNDDVSSLSKDSAAYWGQVKDDVTVDVFRIGRILNEQHIPFDFDVLSLDIEGFDTMVMNDMIENTPYRPGIVIIESSLDFKNTSIISAGMSAAVDAAYELKYQTVANMILVRK
jgi:FkbM family methyltransferase